MKQNGRWPQEFWILVAMLSALVALVYFVLGVPIHGQENTNTTLKEILDYRSNILAVIVTAFGAWIGAGAAYYFGREQLNQATESMLQMREKTPSEIMKNTTVKELGLSTFKRLVKGTDEIGPIFDWLRENPEEWFVPVIQEDGTLQTVMNEELVYRYVDKSIRSMKDQTVETALDDIKKRKVQEILDYAKRNPELKKIADVFVPVSLNTTIDVAINKMENEDVKLAVVLDDDKKPHYYFEESDVGKIFIQKK